MPFDKMELSLILLGIIALWAIANIWIFKKTRTVSPDAKKRNIIILITLLLALGIEEIPFSPSLPVFIGILVGVILFAALLCWIFQRKSTVHPIQNGIIAAATSCLIPLFINPVEIDLGLIAGGGDGPSSVFIVLPSTTITLILFLLLLLPGCILFCKKLAKANKLIEK